ncbi:MAG: hypothetical protein ACW99A_13395 [Candidatus Kariarchaeaceae archaeon]|jgi:hypothetical protein
MALEPSEQFQYDIETANKLRLAKINFIDYKNSLQAIFDELQSVIDNPDTQPTWIAELVASKAQGKTVIQDMLNSIT